MEQVEEVGHDSKGIKRSYSDAMPCSEDDDNKAKKPVPEVASPNSTSGNGNVGASQPLVLGTDSNSTDKSKLDSESSTGGVSATDPSKDVIVYVHGEGLFPSFYGALLNTMRFSGAKLVEDYSTHKNMKNKKDVFTATFSYKRDGANAVKMADAIAYCKFKSKKRASEASFKMLLESCYTITSLRQTNMSDGISFRAMNEGKFNSEVNPSYNGAENEEVYYDDDGKAQSVKGLDRMTPEFRMAADHFVQEYIKKQGVEDLVFLDDMKNLEQRNYVTNLLSKHKNTLNVKLLGETPNRFISISYKYGPFALLNKLLAFGKNEKYQAFPPNTLNIHQFRNLFKWGGKKDFKKKISKKNNTQKNWRKKQRKLAKLNQ